MPGWNLNTALPELVSCAKPRRWMSVQNFAVALQKLIWPLVTGTVPARTVAVSVTTPPEATDVTALPFEVTVSVAVVAGDVAKASGALALTTVQRAMQSDSRKGTFNFTGTSRRIPRV